MRRRGPDRTGGKAPRKRKAPRQQAEFAYSLLFGCVSNGDAENYPFFLDLFQTVGPKGPDNYRERLFLNLLTEGKNPTFLPILVSAVRYPDEWADQHYEWFRFAFSNRNPCMLCYVLSIIQPHQLPGYKKTIHEEFLSIHTCFGKACGQLTWNMGNKITQVGQCTPSTISFSIGCPDKRPLFDALQ